MRFGLDRVRIVKVVRRAWGVKRAKRDETIMLYNTNVKRGSIQSNIERHLSVPRA